jgi:Ca2+-binding EF-hand superfamily protein
MNERNENLMAHNFKKNSNIVHTTNSTEIMYNKKKLDQFEKIFRLLDQDEDGVISTLNITVKNLPQQIVRILNPIIQLLKEDNIRLSLVEFIKECEYLFEVRS